MRALLAGTSRRSTRTFRAGYTGRVLRCTFQIAPGVGPTREQALWRAGVDSWDALLAGATTRLPGTTDQHLRDAAARMTEALVNDDLNGLAARLPDGEQWRLFDHFGGEAVYLDIETDEEDGITAIGLLGPDGPRILLAGRDVDAFPEAMRHVRFLVTFNGRSFDVPVLQRSFPDWTPPVVHVDLCHLWRRLGRGGGLKRLEDLMGMGRPDHLRSVTGREACWMWRHARHGDREALRRFAEYNLYDAINLRTLLGMGYNQMIDQLQAPATPVHVQHRGDVLYDVSKLLLSL
jgi:uncharacterized protein